MTIDSNTLEKTTDQTLADPRVLTAVETGVVAGKVKVFIDADNQAPALAKPLLDFLVGIGRRADRIFIAGNGSGDRVKGWQIALQDIEPEVPIAAHIAPMRKQSADVRLMFELATLFHGQPDPQGLILIFSRDDLLLAAAEALKSQGHHVLIAVGASAPAAPLTTELPVVVLPQPQTASAQTAQKEAVTPAEAKQAAVPTEVVPQVVNAAITKIRQALSQSKGGGYAASAVGQVLSQMGYDKATRARIVKAIPNMKETGVGADKRLVF